MATKGVDKSGRFLYLNDFVFTGDADLIDAVVGKAIDIISWNLTPSGGAGVVKIAFQDGAAGDAYAGAVVAQNTSWRQSRPVGLRFTAGNKVVLKGGLAATVLNGFVEFETA